MHLGKPLQRRVITPRPETLPEPAPVDDGEPVRAGEPVEPPVADPQPAG